MSLRTCSPIVTRSEFWIKQNNKTEISKIKLQKISQIHEKIHVIGQILLFPSQK